MWMCLMTHKINNNEVWILFYYYWLHMVFVGVENVLVSEATITKPRRIS